MTAAPAVDSVALAHRIRNHALEMTSRGGSAHVGSVMSMADIIAVLYGRVMRIDPKQPAWSGRDRFVLSKGHAGAGVYAALAERGFFPAAELLKHCQDGSPFSGHVSHKNVPGVEFSTGSLGHGLPVATGMAVGLRLAKNPARVFCMLSDGECDEGSVWEAAMFAAHHKLGALTVVVDYNKIQSLDTVEATLGLEPFTDKWRAFGWTVTEVDGHNHDALYEAIAPPSAPSAPPRCVMAHTVKGKGVSFMERSVLWHYRTAKGDELNAARAELNPSSAETK